MKTRSVLFSLAFASAQVLLADQASAAVPPTDLVGVPAYSDCKPPNLLPSTIDQIFHFDKIVFQILGPLQAALPADQPALNLKPFNTPFDIKVVDNPKTVADLKAKVLTFLKAAVIPGNRANIRIENVLYATAVCPPQ